MKYYLINDSKDWADEFDVQFYEILNEEEYQKYMYCKEKLGKFESDFYFGTNEGWDEGDEFDYLDFEPIEISDDDAHTLKRYFPHETEQIFERLIERLEDKYDIDLYYSTIAKFKDAIDEIMNQENDNKGRIFSNNKF